MISLALSYLDFFPWAAQTLWCQTIAITILFPGQRSGALLVKFYGISGNAGKHKSPPLLRSEPLDQPQFKLHNPRQTKLSPASGHTENKRPQATSMYPAARSGR